MALTFHQDSYTICFSEENNSFESFYSYKPEMMGCIGTKLYSFKNGAIWAHNNDSTFCNFYGVQYPCSITTVFGQAVTNRKTYVSVKVTANDVWACPLIYTQMQSYGSHALGGYQRQESELKTVDFEDLESEYEASFLNDVWSQGGLINGSSLKGGYMVIKFEYDTADSFVFLNSASVKYIDSALNAR